MYLSCLLLEVEITGANRVLSLGGLTFTTADIKWQEVPLATHMVSAVNLNDGGGLYFTDKTQKV